MASARFNVEKGEVTLKLSTSEALYVAAELAGGNSYFHCVDHSFGDFGVYSALVAALDVAPASSSRRSDRHGLDKSYKAHVAVAKATRPEYDSEAGTAAGRKHGFLGEND